MKYLFNGGLAQLGERLPCTQEVSGSIPLVSISNHSGYFFCSLKTEYHNMKVTKKDQNIYTAFIEDYSL